MRQAQRRNIVEDIASWRKEVGAASTKDCAQDLEDKTDEGLETVWYKSVGKWILEQQSFKQLCPEDSETEEFVEEAFERVKNSRSKPYAYRHK